MGWYLASISKLVRHTWYSALPGTLHSFCSAGGRGRERGGRQRGWAAAGGRQRRPIGGVQRVPPPPAGAAGSAPAPGCSARRTTWRPGARGRLSAAVASWRAAGGAPYPAAGGGGLAAAARAGRHAGRWSCRRRWGAAGAPRERLPPAVGAGGGPWGWGAARAVAGGRGGAGRGGGCPAVTTLLALLRLHQALLPSALSPDRQATLISDNGGPVHRAVLCAGG